MQIKDYTKVNELSDNDIFLIDGNDGTRTINSVNAANTLAKKVNAENARNALDYGSLGYHLLNKHDQALQPMVMLYDINSNTYFKCGLYNSMVIGIDSFGDTYPGIISAMNHKMLIRNQNLGSVVTDEQWEAISSGKFTDLFVGDFWRINGINWYIVDIDYWTNNGNAPNNAHHLVIMPSSPIGGPHRMNPNPTNSGGYVGTELRTNEFQNIKAIITAAFPEEHLYIHPEILTNYISDDGASASYIWEDSVFEIPSITMLFGSISSSGFIKIDNTIDKNQLFYCVLRPDFINQFRSSIWLRNTYSNNSFMYMNYDGCLGAIGADTTNIQVVPIFAIKG